MQRTIHVLTANGSVTDTKTGRTLGDLVHVDYGESILTVVNHTSHLVTKFYVLQVTDAQPHGVVANVEKLDTETSGQIASEWSQNNREELADGDRVMVDGGEYFAYHHHDILFFIGEETVLDSDKKELGFISTRGGSGVIVAFEPGGGREAGRIHWSGATQFNIETEGDLIDVMLKLRAEGTK